MCLRGFACCGFSDRLRRNARTRRRSHLRANGTQFVHYFTVYGAYLGVDLGRQLNVPGESLFDTKTSAMNRHRISLTPSLRSALKQTRVKMRYTQKPAWKKSDEAKSND